MRYGTIVAVQRGSERIKSGPGKLRIIEGVYIGGRSWQRKVRLLQDDPFATVGYCTKKGDVGHWSASCVRPLEQLESSK